MQAASEAAAYRGEHRGVVAAALLHGGGGADVGVQAEQAGARADHDGGVVAVVRQPRHRVLHRTGNRLRAGEDLLVAFLELVRSEEHTSELQSLMRNPYSFFLLQKKKQTHYYH